MHSHTFDGQHGLLGHELVIDNFAGGGGASAGIEAALGRPVDVAINHDPAALAMHAANHPHTRHLCESVWSVDPREVTQGRPVGLAWFSPDCKHFSRAKGGRPVEKGIRGLAWVAIRWAATVRPRVIMVENVPEFVTWGPLVKDGGGAVRPCPQRRGQTFRAFVNALRRHGYAVEQRVLSAADYGTPTIRRRLFLVARRDGLPIAWPRASHGDGRGRAAVRTAAECIDWSIPCPSIFGRARPLAEATLRRIADGLRRYVLACDTPFVVPAGALPAAPFITEHANASSQRNMPADEPLRTICGEVKGGHFALVAAFLAKHYTGVVGSDLREPLGTVTAVDHHALVTSSLCLLRGGCTGQALQAPMLTVTAGDHFAEVRAFLVKYYGAGGQHQPLSVALHTIPTVDRFGLVTVAGERYRIADIGMRMLTPRELARAQGFPDDYALDVGGDRRLSKSAQVRMIGNSVCPPVAEALVRANCAHESRMRGAEWLPLAGTL